MRRSLNVGVIALATALLVSACTSGAAPKARTTPSGGASSVVPSPTTAMPTEPAPTQTPAKAVPDALVGDWKVVQALDVDMTKVRRASLRFYSPSQIDPRWAFPINGGANDGCNGGTLLAVIGPAAGARIYPGVTTQVACSPPLVPLYKVFTETRSWGLSTREEKTFLTFYNADHKTVAVFERVAQP